MIQINSTKASVFVEHNQPFSELRDVRAGIRKFKVGVCTGRANIDRQRYRLSRGLEQT
jgi:hypothetical protein